MPRREFRSTSRSFEERVWVDEGVVDVEVSYISPDIVGTDAGSKGTFEERKVVGPISLFGIIRDIQEIQKFQDMIQSDLVP